ncbi:MAG: ankyrin repeat domain-containing protein [Alphaproteobacteria bacterium]|nr:ankyrin repeat domain-containing protein [Alphaproteobacteria bacterium]
MFTLASKIRTAIMNDDVPALEKLTAGRNPAALTVWEGHSGLFTAARKGKRAAAQFFIENGSDPNRDEGYWSPLQCAAYYGRLEIVAMMIKAGGDPNRRDNNEKTARDLAEGRGFKDIVTLLTPYMKDPLAALMPESAAREGTAEKPAAVAAGDSWSLLAEDTAAHVFGSGNTGYRITEIFNFSARERTRIISNLETQADDIKTVSFDTLAEGVALAAALAQLQRLGGKADPESAQILPRLDKPQRGKGPAA